MKHRPVWMRAFEARNPQTIISENTFRARTAFNKDLSSVVHANFFKRLSHKTQVFSLPYNDHVHTRLTHSIEASQIGRQIARYFCVSFIRKIIRSDDFHELANDIEELTAAACLAHDIGHAPFGHTGKKVIEEFCKANKSSQIFDDNKQVVRILLNEFWFEKINPSGPFLASILKKREVDKCSYRTEQTKVEAVLNSLNLFGLRHPASLFMEAADDIAYLSGDLIDYLSIYSGENKRLVISGFDKVKAVNSSGVLEERSLQDYFDDALSSSDEQKIQDFSDSFIRAALGHVFSVIDDFASNYLTQRQDLENVPIEFCAYLKTNGVRPNGKVDENLLYSTGVGEIGPVFYGLKAQIYDGAILEEPFVADQDALAHSVLSGILTQAFSMTSASDLSESKIFQRFPREAQHYLEVAKERRELDVAIIDLVSGMTDRYAISFWKEVVGLSALDRLTASAFKKAS